MTKSTITRERLEKIKSWCETYGAGSNVMLPAEEAEGLARMALAAMDSEPVAWQIHTPEAGVTYVETNPQSVENIRNGFGVKVEITPLYRHPQPAPDLNSVSINDNHPLPNPPAENGIPKTAYCGEGLCLSEPITPDTIEGVLPPEMIARGNKIVNPRSAGLYLNDILHPAPVVPDGLKEAAADFLSVLDEYPERLVPINRDSAVVRALRAAMLPENPVCTCPSGDGSLRWPCPVHPGNSPVIPDGYVMVPKEPTQAMCAAFNDSDYGRKSLRERYVAMLAAAAHDTPALNSVQSVATVPGKWIPVSERMPDDDDFVYIWPRPDFGVELHVGQYCECSPKGDGWYAQVYEQNYGIEWYPITVTHWMPLPAAPQEVSNEK